MGDDSTMKKDSETIVVQLEKNHEKEDSSEATPQNEAPVELEVLKFVGQPVRQDHHFGTQNMLCKTMLHIVY